MTARASGAAIRLQASPYFSYRHVVRDRMLAPCKCAAAKAMRDIVEPPPARVARNWFAGNAGWAAGRQQPVTRRAGALRRLDGVAKRFRCAASLRAWLLASRETEGFAGGRGSFASPRARRLIAPAHSAPV